MRNKRGDLSLSTNAIVVLIIAITILGLALGFTRGIFTTLGDRIKSIGGSTIIKTPASLDDPITFTNDKIEVRKGKSVEQVVSVFNRYDDEAEYSLSLTCYDEDNNDATDLFTFVRGAPKIIKVNEHVEFSTTIKVSQDADGLYACTIIAEAASLSEIEQKDLTVTVT